MASKVVVRHLAAMRPRMNSRSDRAISRLWPSWVMSSLLVGLICQPALARGQSQSRAPGRTEAAPGVRCEMPLRERLYQAAIAAPNQARDDGTLYGMQRWYPATQRRYLGVDFPGVLSCAYTVSAIFGGACHPLGKLPSVKKVDAALARWKRVESVRDLRRGDVIFWKPKKGRVWGIQCPGRWHVGISVGGDATVDNDWWSGMPKKGTIDRACGAFAYARRPPEERPGAGGLSLRAQNGTRTCVGAPYENASRPASGCSQL
jgi:hypothetical protein